ncbi:MAG: flagellar biosynthetic protein FliR [Acidobacteriota bacterium]
MQMDFFQALAGLVAAVPLWWMATFIIFARVGAVFILFPILGGASLPAMARLGAGLGFAFLVAGLLEPGSIPLPHEPAGMVLLLGREMLIGISLGFVARCVISGLEFSGEIAAQQMGLTLAAIFDPVSNSPITPVTTFQRFLVGALFFSLGGHRVVLGAMLHSYTLLPAGIARVGPGMASTMGDAVLAVVQIGLVAAAPVVVILLVVEIVMMAIGRTAPQIPMLLVGFPVRVAAGFFGLALSLQTLPRLTTGALTAFTQFSDRIVRSMAAGA